MSGARQTVLVTGSAGNLGLRLLRELPDLRVIGVVGGELNIDFLVGAGAVGVVDTCSVTLGEFARTGPNFARYVMAGRVRALDNT